MEILVLEDIPNWKSFHISRRDERDSQHWLDK